MKFQVGFFIALNIVFLNLMLMIIWYKRTAV